MTTEEQSVQINRFLSHMGRTRDNLEKVEGIICSHPVLLSAPYKINPFGIHPIISVVKTTETLKWFDGVNGGVSLDPFVTEISSVIVILTEKF